MPSREELLGYLLGALDAHEQELVEYHLLQFPELEAELHELKSCLEPLSVLAGDDEYSAPGFPAPGFSAPGLARRTIEHVARVARDPSYRVEFSANPPTPHPPVTTPPPATANPVSANPAVCRKRKLRVAHPSPQRVVLMAISAVAVSLSLAPRSGSSWGELPTENLVVTSRSQLDDFGQSMNPPPLFAWGRTCRVTWIPDRTVRHDSHRSAWEDTRAASPDLWPPAAVPPGLVRASQRSIGSSRELAAAEADLMVRDSSRE